MAYDLDSQSPTASCWVCRNCQVCHPRRHPWLPELSKVYGTRRRDFPGNLHCGLTGVHLSGPPYDAKPRALGRHHFNIIPGNSWSSVHIVKKGEERGSHSHWCLTHVSILGILCSLTMKLRGDLGASVLDISVNAFRTNINQILDDQHSAVKAIENIEI